MFENISIPTHFKTFSIQTQIFSVTVFLKTKIQRNIYVQKHIDSLAFQIKSNLFSPPKSHPNMSQLKRMRVARVIHL